MAWQSPTAESRILPLSIDELPYALSKDLWKPDNTIDNCTDCHKIFTFWRRKHHCRRCGYIYCHQCTAKLCPYVNLENPERICRLCRTILVTNAVRHRYRRQQTMNQMASNQTFSIPVRSSNSNEGNKVVHKVSKSVMKETVPLDNKKSSNQRISLQNIGENT